ncbi:hypothetical protein FQN50_000807 [Emmonsiellopsis sp. PD_5]|nr:hypothetical protein FQN50_000807 [Emmonsiellopsis sp. PD_5]
MFCMSVTVEDPTIWPSLQFAVSPNEDQATAAREEPHQFNITLELQDKSMLIPPSKTLRLPHSIAISSSAIQPPPGIPYVYLQEIEISFSFSPTYPGHDDRPDKIPRSTSFEDLSALTNPRNDFLDYIPKPSSGGDEIYYSSQSTIQSHDNDWMSLDDDSPFSSQQTSSSSYSSIPNNQGPEQQNTSSKPSYRPFLTLLNVGFRNLLRGDPSRTASIITTTIEKPGPTLSNFAPSIFCPRYETEITQRARFIPMISKGLAAMFDMSPSSELRSKLARINTSPTGCNYPEASTNEQSADGKSLLKMLLWKSMQRGLFSPETTRKLPCLATAPTYKGNRESSNNITTQPAALPTGKPNTTPLHTAISDTECLFRSTTSPPPPSPSFSFSFSDDDLLTDTTNTHKEEDFIDPFDTPIYPTHTPLSTHQIPPATTITTTSTVPEPHSPISSLLDDYIDEPYHNLPTPNPTTSFSQNPNFHHQRHQHHHQSIPTAIKTTPTTLPSSPLIITSSSDIELLDPSSPAVSTSNETTTTRPGAARDIIMAGDDDILFNAPVVAGGVVGFGGGDGDDDDDGCGEDANVAGDVDVDVDVEMLLL